MHIPHETPQRISFFETLEDSDNWLKWIEESEKIKNESLSFLDWHLIGKRNKEFSDKLKQLPPDRRLIINSLYISLVAGFENFLRQTIEYISNHHNSHPKEFCDKLVKANIRESAKILGKMDSPLDHLNFKLDEYCKIIGSFSKEGEKVILNPSALANVDSLIKLENFIKRLEVFEIEIDFDKLGNCADLRKSIKVVKGSRDAGKEIKDELSTVSKNRNRIAHLGNTASDVSEEIYMYHKEFLNQLSIEIDKIIINKLFS